MTMLSYMGVVDCMFAPLENLYIGNLSPKVMVFGDGTLGS